MKPGDKNAKQKEFLLSIVDDLRDMYEVNAGTKKFDLTSLQDVVTTSDDIAKIKNAISENKFKEANDMVKKFSDKFSESPTLESISKGYIRKFEKAVDSFEKENIHQDKGVIKRSETKYGELISDDVLEALAAKQKPVPQMPKKEAPLKNVDVAAKTALPPKQAGSQINRLGQGLNPEGIEVIKSISDAIANKDAKKVDAILSDPKNDAVKKQLNYPFDTRGETLIDKAKDKKTAEVLKKHADPEKKIEEKKGFAARLKERLKGSEKGPTLG